MAIQFKCPHCKTGLEAPDGIVGKKGACPNCKKEITVPKDDSKPQSEGKKKAKKD